MTGGTGFIGQVLIRHLFAMGLQVRTLLRPSRVSPRLPRGIPVEAVICGLKDERGLRAAMKGVDVVYHLATAEGHGSQADFINVDMEGTQTLARVAADANVQRFFYLSHLGADRFSAYTVQKVKAIAENHITHSGVNYTIFRSGVVYGPGDHFTTGLARLMMMSPGIFLMPGEGNVSLQPLWVEDLVVALTLALDDPATVNQIYSIGGPEYLTFREIVETLMSALRLRRWIIPVSPPYLRILSLIMENSTKNFPFSVFWQDYLATDRTCELDTLPRQFGLLPMRFNRQLGYLNRDTLKKTRYVEA